MCEAMKWSHLPQQGGLYDQHPDLLDQFMRIFARRAEVENDKRKKEERERRQKSPGGSRPAGRRR